MNQRGLRRKLNPASRERATNMTQQEREAIRIKTDPQYRRRTASAAIREALGQDEVTNG